MFDECTIRGRRFAPARFCAPLVGYTNRAFRGLLAELGGCGAVWTEMLAARQILSENFRRSPWLRRRPQESCLVYQLVNILSTATGGSKKAVGLAVSRQHPDLIRQKYGLEATPIFWLATRAGEEVISPTNLTTLTNILVRFIEENQEGVILLDGLEYLISNNDFNKILRTIDQVNDHISQSKSLMIIPVDPRAFSPKELALLERNTERLGVARKIP